MAIKLILNSEKVLEKIFPSARNGYDPFEVDSFLDNVLSDYKTIEKNVLMEQSKVDSLNSKIQDLEAKIKSLEIENQKYKARFANIKESDNVTLDNIDLVKKINKYESFLYKLGYNPHTIK